MSSLKLKPSVVAALDVRKPTLVKKKGPGRPPSTREYVGLAEAKQRAAECVEREAKARLLTEVTSRLSAAAAYIPEEGAPLGKIGASVIEALEMVNMVSKKSKGLKGTMTKRLKAAVAIINMSTDELQRRVCALERKGREGGDGMPAKETLRRRAESAEERARSLQMQLDRERVERYAGVGPHASPSSLSKKEDSRKRSPSPAIDWGFTPSCPPSPQVVEWPSEEGADQPVTMGMVVQLTRTLKEGLCQEVKALLQVHGLRETPGPEKGERGAEGERKALRGGVDHPR